MLHAMTTARLHLRRPLQSDAPAFFDMFSDAETCRMDGGYPPYAAMDDGLLDMVLVQPIPRVKIAGFLSQYKSGKHLSRDGVVSDRFRPYLSFCRARSVEIEVLDGRPIIATVDGECQPVTQLCVEAKPASLTVLLPRPALNVCGTITGAYRLPQEVEAAF